MLGIKVRLCKYIVLLSSEKKHIRKQDIRDAFGLNFSETFTQRFAYRQCNNCKTVLLSIFLNILSNNKMRNSSRSHFWIILLQIYLIASSQYKSLFFFKNMTKNCNLKRYLLYNVNSRVQILNYIIYQKLLQWHVILPFSAMTKSVSIVSIGLIKYLRVKFSVSKSDIAGTSTFKCKHSYANIFSFQTEKGSYSKANV